MPLFLAQLSGRGALGLVAVGLAVPSDIPGTPTSRSAFLGFSQVLMPTPLSKYWNNTLSIVSAIPWPSGLFPPALRSSQRLWSVIWRSHPPIPFDLWEVNLGWAARSRSSPLPSVANAVTVSLSLSSSPGHWTLHPALPDGGLGESKFFGNTF